MQCINSLRLRSYLRPLCVGVSTVLLSSCVLGPNYKIPPAVAEHALSSTQFYRANAQTTQPVSPINNWWEQLNDPILSRLINLSIAQNLSLQAAQARLDISRAVMDQRSAERMPSIGASAFYAETKAPDWIADKLSQSTRELAATLQHTANPAAAQALGQGSGNAHSKWSSIYQLGFDAQWELDIFGRRRRALEQAQAQEQADAAGIADMQVQLAAQIGTLYMNYRALQARVQIANTHLKNIQDTLQLAQRQFKLGIGTELDIARIETQVHQQEYMRLALTGGQTVLLDQLALLVGQEPGSLDNMLASITPLPALPNSIAIGNPAELIQHRPDVREAERELAASNAQIGQAMSAYFPQVSLIGSIGMLATSAKQLGSAALNEAVLPMLRWSAFDFGRTRAMVSQAKNGFRAREAAYKGTVLAALEDANASLTQFGIAREQYVSAQQIVDSAQHSDQLMQQRQRLGAATLMNTLDVQRQYLSAEDTLMQAKTQMLVDFISLQKSLGLGWQTESSPRLMSAAKSH